MGESVLKPCPFCAGDANWFWGKSRIGYYGHVKCKDCGASTKLVKVPDELCEDDEFYKDDGFWETKPFKEATRLWNERHRRKQG